MLELAEVTAPTQPTTMKAAAMKYLPDGRVDWENMWDSF